MRAGVDTFAIVLHSVHLTRAHCVLQTTERWAAAELDRELSGGRSLLLERMVGVLRGRKSRDLSIALQFCAVENVPGS